MEMTEEQIAEIEARAASVYPQDAGWSGYEAEDALPVVRDDVPALVAEVRRLRAERDAAVARVRVLERELDAHAWRRAAWMALHMELSEPSTKDGAAWRASRSARRGAWMKSNNVSDAPKGRRRSWVGAWHEFFLRAAGKGSEWKDTEAWLSVAHRIEGDLPADHRDVFFRDGVPVCIVAEPYISSWRDSYHAAWEALAARYGLRLERSIAASWHCPGHTVLYVLWLPSQGGA